MHTVHVRSHRLGLASALLGMAAALGIGPSVPEPRLLKSAGAGPERRRWFYRAGGCKPHQGPRECARRRGGQDWADFKAADRVRRGLPAMKEG
jgi:hypothetical protein